MLMNKKQKLSLVFFNNTKLFLMKPWNIALMVSSRKQIQN